MIDTYIIRINDDVSIELSNELANSLSNYKISYNFFNGIYGDNIDFFWETEKLFFYPKQNEKKKFKGVRGCFLSHYLLWKKCFIENKPLLIFEHDALLIRPLNEEILNKNYDVLNLDYASRIVPNYDDHCATDFGNEIVAVHSLDTTKRGYSKFNKSSIKGIHAYIIKPTGAEKLIEFTKEFGTLPADIQINSLTVDYFFTETSFARVNPKYWNNITKNSKNSFTRD